jgi:3-oxoacyl-[acyl-carrier protein] reductase
MAEDHSIPMKLGLDNSVALVTGGTRGIGAAISREFLHAGCQVIVTARTDESFHEFLETVDPDHRSGVSFLPVEFTDRNSLQVLLEEVEALPRLDVLVNNAGTNINNDIRTLKIEDYDYLHDVNLRAAILLMKSAVSVMSKGAGGRIVNIASIWSEVTRAGRLAYSATKYGLVGATRTAAIDLARQNILVNAVSPGFTLTELTARTLSRTDIDELSERIPAGRFADPSEIAGMVVFLCSRWNTYITGQNIVIDGGYTVV